MEQLRSRPRIADVAREAGVSKTAVSFAFNSPDRLAPETAIFASSTDGVVLVVRANRTRREVVQKAIDVLNKARCRLLGVVLNDRRYPIPGFIYRRI